MFGWASSGQIVGAILVTFVVGLLIRLIGKFQPGFGSVLVAVLVSAAARLAMNRLLANSSLVEAGPVVVAGLAILTAILVQSLLLVGLVRGSGGERLTIGQALSVTLLEAAAFVALALLFRQLS